MIYENASGQLSDRMHFLHCSLFSVQRKHLHYPLDTAVLAENAGVEAQVIACRVAPFLARVVMVIRCAALVLNADVPCDLSFSSGPQDAATGRRHLRRFTVCLAETARLSAALFQSADGCDWRCLRCWAPATASTAKCGIARTSSHC